MKKKIGPHHNAVSHGVFVHGGVLPWESPERLGEILKGLREEFVPDGMAEDEAVSEIAICLLKKTRLAECFRLAHGPSNAADPGAKDGAAAPGARVAAAAAEAPAFRETLRAIARSHANALHGILQSISREVEKAVTPPKEANTNDNNPESQIQADDGERLEKLTSLAQSLNAAGANLISPLLKMIETSDFAQDLAERAFRPELIERELQLLTLINKQIEKAMIRLVQLKEYKRIYKRPLLNDAATRQPSLPAG